MYSRIRPTPLLAIAHFLLIPTKSRSSVEHKREGYETQGLFRVVNTFPGHGGTLLDSHDDQPKDERSLEELTQIDLYPFQQVIAEGIEMIMSAHVVYPALDPDFPATASRKILTGLLRQQIGIRWRYYYR